MNIKSLPQRMAMGNALESAIFVMVLKTCGQSLLGPRGVADQSMEPIRFAISPPPISHSEATLFPGFASNPFMLEPHKESPRGMGKGIDK